MIGRWTLRVSFLALIPIVVCAQLDRASYQRPELSLFVPRPFRSIAQAPTALLALAGGDAARAGAEARALVRRRPMPAEHLFTLAMAELMAGRPERFAAAFRASSTRGWRFGPLQVAAAQAALDNRDAEGAAKRVAAIWAAEGGHPSLPVLTRSLLDLPGGPEAFGAILARSPFWRDNFLAYASGVTAPSIAIRTVIAAQRAGARFDCDALDAFRTQMASQGQSLPSLDPCA